MNWKKLLLIGSVAGLVAFVPVRRSDAGVSVGIGIGFPGYYGYYPYGYYSPYYSDRIRIMATIGLIIGTAGTVITTVTTDIITTIGTKLT